MRVAGPYLPKTNVPHYTTEKSRRSEHPHSAYHHPQAAWSHRFGALRYRTLHGAGEPPASPFGFPCEESLVAARLPSPMSLNVCSGDIIEQPRSCHPVFQSARWRFEIRDASPADLRVPNPQIRVWQLPVGKPPNNLTETVKLLSRPRGQDGWQSAIWRFANFAGQIRRQHGTLFISLPPVVPR